MIVREPKWQAALGRKSVPSGSSVIRFQICLSCGSHDCRPCSISSDDLFAHRDTPLPSRRRTVKMCHYEERSRMEETNVLEKRRRRNMESFAQFLYMGFVENTLLVQDFG